MKRFSITDTRMKHVPYRTMQSGECFLLNGDLCIAYVENEKEAFNLTRNEVVDVAFDTEVERVTIEINIL